MANPKEKKIWVTWTGGVDSTALVGKLLRAGFEVHPITLLFGPENYQANEASARAILSKYFREIFPGAFHYPILVDGSFLTKFSSSNGEILRRNKHILDYIMMNHVIPDDFYYVGMGTYIGSDTSAVDHLKGMDTDSRYMAAYLLSEYGINWQFMSLADFGPSRYKSDQVRMLIDVVGVANSFHTYNCMDNRSKHCGQCYKCVERAAAFYFLKVKDQTEYVGKPQSMWYFDNYLSHFHGYPANLKWEEIKFGKQGTHFNEKADE